MAAFLSACGGVAATPSQPHSGKNISNHSTPTPGFDARGAYDEFEETFRLAYAYLERDDFSVEAQLAHTRRLALRATNEAMFRRTLHQSTFAFTDPHFIVGPLDDADPNVFPTSSDLVIGLHGNAFVVIDVRQGSPADLGGVRPAWRLISIDGLLVDTAIERVWNGAVLARTDKQRAYAATLAANGLRKGTRALGFEAGGPRVITLENPFALAKRIEARPPLSVERRGTMAVIRFENSLGKDETIEAFDEVIARIGSVEAVVLDLRNTPSGGNTNVARSIIGHFITEPRPYQMHEIPAVERKTSVPRRFVEYALPRKPYYAGRVAVLGGHWTGSMGEGLVIGLHGAAHARTFVSDMGDLLGALHNFDMKHSNVRVDLGAETLFHVDGTHRENFIGDIPLASADRDADGHDPAMAAVAHWLAQPGRVK
jgi:carboxyl-terminal processing protease